jgi:hypothetical protein
MNRTRTVAGVLVALVPTTAALARAPAPEERW